MSERSYTFRTIEHCDMCRATDFKMLGMRLNATQGLRPKSVSGIGISVKECRACGLIFPDPQPIPASIQDHYGVPPEEYWHDFDFEEDPTYMAEEIAAAKRLLGFRQGMRALDIGVGLGHMMRAMERAGFEAQGIEPSASFHARLDQTKVQLATAEDAEFLPNSFDFITFGAVLEHLYSPSLAIERALVWLKPGGVIHVHVPSSKHLIAKLINLFYRLRGTNYITHLSPMHLPYHLYEFDVESFRRNGRLLGYEVAQVDHEVCVVSHVPAPLVPAFRLYMDRTGKGMMFTAYLRKVA
ncbi:MAG: class I SAM-dependent methyltransferase [Sphingomicrobium sp.]